MFCIYLQKESISSLSDDGKKDEIQEVLSDATYDKANKLTKDMNEAGLDDGRMFYNHDDAQMRFTHITSKTTFTCF